MRDVESRGGAYAYPKLLQDSSGLWHLFYSHDYSHIQHAWFDEDWLEEGRQVLA
jgi:predicted neuraminidase